MKCKCNCHDPQMRAVMNMKKHKTCADCRKALREEARWLAKMERKLRSQKK